MNSIKYDGDLKKDIEYSKRPFNSKKEIRDRVISFIAGIPIYIFGACIVGLDKETLKSSILYYSSLYVVLESLLQYYVYKKNKKDFGKKFDNSNFRIDDLVHQLNENEILVLKENIQSSIIKEHQEKKEEERNEVKNSTEVIENQFYFLDREEKVRLLKSVRKILKEGRKVTSDETSLYYSDEDLTNNEDSPVRVIKYLEKF